jgi:hypothetical protein
MSVTIAKPDEVVIVQVPGSWTIRDIRLEQSRVTRWCAKQDIATKVVIVGGGPEMAGVPDSPVGLEELQNEMADS